VEHVTVIILSFLGKFWPIIAGALGVLGWGIAQRRYGAKAERAKQAASEAKARDIADSVDNDLGTLTPEQRREALKTWSRGARP
jgi:hypothetical protein